MSGKDYIIPLGVDTEGLVNPLNQTIDTLEKVESAAQGAGKELSDSFSKSAKTLEQMDDKLKPIQKNLEAVKMLGKQAGKELADAFNERNIDPSKLEAVTQKFLANMSNLTAKVNIDVDPAKLQIFEKQLANTKNEVEELELVMKMAKEVLASMDPNSQEYIQLAEAIQFTDSALNEFANSVDTTVTKQKTLKGELRAIKAELAAMELAGEAGSQRFRELSLRAGELEDQIGDTNAQIKILASDTATFDGLISGATGLVGAFTAAQGAAALFGGENEALQETMNKVMGAMAVLQGLQAVADTLNKDSAFSVIFLRNARVADAAATEAQAAANISNTAATAASVAATEALVAAEAQEAAATLAATAASEAHTIANTEETAAALAAALAAEAEATALRQNAAAEVASAVGAEANAVGQVAQTGAMSASAIAANVLGFALKAIGIGLIITAVAALVEYWDELKDGMNALLPAGTSVGKMFDKIKSYAFGVGNAVIQYLITPFKAAYQAMTGDFEGAWESIKKGYDVVGNFKEGKLKQDARNEEKYRNEAEQKDIDAKKRELERAKNRGQDVYAQEQALRKREIALKKKTREDTEGIQKEMEDAEDKRYADNQKKAEAAAKKAEADRKRAAEKAKADAKKAAEEAKKQAELVLKYTDEINKARLAGIDDSYQRERETIKTEAENRIRDLAKDGAKSAAAIAKQKELIQAINEEANNKLQELEKKHNSEVLKLRLEGAKMLQDLSKDTKEKEIALLEIENQEAIENIKTKFEKETDLKNQLLAKQEEYFARKSSDINLKYAQKELKESEEKGILLLELSEEFAGKSEKTEEQKQLALLELKAQYAKESLDLLLNSGKDENDIEVLKAKKLVKDTRDAVEEEAKKGKKFDFFDFVGLDLSKDQKTAVLDAGKQMMDGLSEITSFMIDQYQQQIDKKQEVIDQLDNEISDLEDRLDEEKQLREDGFANNVEVIEKELEAKKAQREKELEDQKEMQRKQKEFQKAQMMIDTTIQLVNMITAATNIFKTLSSIPFIGIPLAIATIGVMFGAFAVAKVKAFQSINSGTKMAKGGWIDGYSHEQGGKKYYAADGSVTELEKDEFVTRKKQAKKYAKLLEAINNDNFEKLTFADMEAMGLFEALGIDLSNSAIFDAIDDNKELAALESNYSVNVEDRSAGSLQKISDDIGYLARAKKDEIEVWEDAHFYYQRKGTKVIKIRK